MTAKKQKYTMGVDVNVNAIGFVLGKGRMHLNNLKNAYPDVKIWMTQNGSFTTLNMESYSANKIESCKNELVKLKLNGEALYESIAQRKRIEKNIESQRKAIFAGQKIREALETEMKQKHREEIQKKIETNIVVVETEKPEDDKPVILCSNKFLALLTE